MSGTPSTLQTELSAALLAARSKPPRSFGQWCREELVIPDGTHRGDRFRFETQPAAGLWCEAIDSGLFSEFVFTAPSQFGKTLIGFIAPILYHTCELAENFVLGVPFGDMFQNKWEADLRPAMDASPRLRRLLPVKGGGSKGGRIHDSVTLANGAILKAMSAGGDDATKAGFTARSLAVTELARFSAAGDTSEEADPFRQLRARQRSFSTRERRTYAEGTVTTEDQLPWSLRKESSQSQIVAPCPHCGVWIAPERDDLGGWSDARTDAEALDMATWFCPACGQEIDETQRHAAVRDAVLLHGGQSIDKRGKITGEVRPTLRLWFRATPFFNLFLTPGDSAVEEWRAARLEDDTPERRSADKELSQFIWCVPYVPPKLNAEIEVDKKAVAARRLQIPAGTIPDDTVVLTAGVDMGGRKSWYLIRALREAGQIHIPRYGQIDIDSENMPLEDALIAALHDLNEQILSLGLTLQTSGIARELDQVWIDAGWQGNAVKTFVANVGSIDLDTPYLTAIGRGESQLQRARFDVPRKTGNVVREIADAESWYVERLATHDALMAIWDSDSTKERSQQGMTLAAGTPGSITLHAGTKKEHERLARHWTNEKLVTVVHPSRGDMRKWKRTGDNHLLDCYGMAAAAADRVLQRRANRAAASDVWNYSE